MRELDYTVPGWPLSFYDYTLGILSVPAAHGASAAESNANEVFICGHTNAIMVRWFDLPPSE